MRENVLWRVNERTVVVEGVHLGIRAYGSTCTRTSLDVPLFNQAYDDMPDYEYAGSRSRIFSLEMLRDAESSVRSGRRSSAFRSCRI